jgi:hypothetical protein
MSNTSGQAYAFLALTPIIPGEEPALRAAIEGFAVTRPFERLPRTHFARLVILPDWVNDPEQPDEDHLRSQYLIFSTTLDGPRDTYLDELCKELAPEAREVWGRCVGSPKRARGAPLKRYLLHNQIDIGFFVAAYPQATVQQVTGVLALRTRVADLAIRTQGLGASELRAAYKRELV